MDLRFILKIKSPTFAELLTDRGHPGPNILIANIQCKSDICATLPENSFVKNQTDPSSSTFALFIGLALNLPCASLIIIIQVFTSLTRSINFRCCSSLVFVILFFFLCVFFFGRFVINIIFSNVSQSFISFLFFI